MNRTYQAKVGQKTYLVNTVNRLHYIIFPSYVQTIGPTETNTEEVTVINFVSVLPNM